MRSDKPIFDSFESKCSTESEGTLNEPLMIEPKKESVPMKFEIPQTGNLHHQFPSNTDESQYNRTDSDLEHEVTSDRPSNDQLLRHSQKQKQPFFSRAMSPMQSGSIRGSVLTLICGCVGAGVLSLPRVFSYFGLTISILLILFCSWFSYVSYIALIEVIKKCNKNSYANLVSFYLGKVIFLKSKNNRNSLNLFV